jgi:sugar lactone lactonase YvrE
MSPQRARPIVAVCVLLLTACAGEADPPSDAGGLPSDRPTVSAAPSEDAATEGLSCPDGLAVDHAGTLYAADVCTNRVLQWSSEGGWTAFAGTGLAGFSGDGEPATDAELDYAGGVLADDEGNVYIAECGGNVVRLVTPDGIIGTVAGVGGLGAGNGGYAGDGGPATEAELACASDGALDSSGNLYIVDRDNSVVRRVDASGTITTIAGGGTLDTSGPDAPAEGRPATEAQFAAESPVHVEVDADGIVYLADEKAHRVWMIDASGTLHAFAGTGVAGFSGDGGAANEAELNGPYGLALDGAGNLYIGDYENARIRRVERDGTITTIAGNGEVGTAGDGAPATEAQLQSPYGIVVDTEGNLYIADQENAAVRIVDPEGIIDTR